MWCYCRNIWSWNCAVVSFHRKRWRWERRKDRRKWRWRERKNWKSKCSKFLYSALHFAHIEYICHNVCVCVRVYMHACMWMCVDVSHVYVCARVYVCVCIMCICVRACVYFERYEYSCRVATEGHKCRSIIVWLYSLVLIVHLPTIISIIAIYSVCGDMYA